MISLVDVPQPPPVAVARSPVPGIFVQSFPVLISEQERKRNRHCHDWPIPHKKREDLISEHGADSILSPDAIDPVSRFADSWESKQTSRQRCMSHPRLVGASYIAPEATHVPWRVSPLCTVISAGIVSVRDFARDLGSAVVLDGSR
jgi:hypothetical protein